MEPTELLRLVGAELDRLRCQRFTTGSLASILFFREGGAQKHLRDIASMIAVQGAESLDWAYLAGWAARLGIADELRQVRPGGA